MAFLSGVLEAVKNENEVTTYDNYMTNKLEKVVKEVNKQIGSGRAGLAESVTLVKGWLEGYEGKLLSMTGAVGSALYELSNDISGRQISDIHDSQRLEEQLKEWKTTLTNISQNVRKIETDQVNMLDYTLCNKLISEIKVVKQAVQVMKESANDGGLERQVRVVDSQLERQRDKVKKEIEDEAFNLQMKWNGESQKMLQKIRSLNDGKIKQFELIKGAVSKTKQDVDGLLRRFATHYKDYIAGRFSEIRSQMKKIDPKNGNSGSELRERFNALKGEVSRLGTEFSTRNVELMTWKEEALSVVKAASILVENILKEFGKEEDKNPQKIIESAHKLMKDAVKLRQAMTEAQTYISKQVSDALLAVPKLEAAVRHDFQSLRNAIRGTVGAYVQSLATKITKELRGLTKVIAKKHNGISVPEDDALQTASLDDIEDGIGKYVTDLKERFEKKVTQMVHKMVDSGAVKSCLYSYANRDSAAMFKKKINEQIGILVRGVSAPQVDENKVETNINNIVKYFEDYAAAVEPTTAVNSIKPRIQDDHELIRSATNNDKRNLDAALKSIFTAVQYAALQIKDEVKTFTTGANGHHLGSKLDAAIAAVESLDMDLADKIKTGASTSDLAQQLRSEAEGKISEIYGGNGGDVTGFGPTYNNDPGTLNVTKLLQSIQTDDGLGKIKEVKDKTQHNLKIDDISLNKLYKTVERSLARLVEVIRTHSGGIGEDGLKQKLDDVTKGLGQCDIWKTNNATNVYGLDAIYNQLNELQRKIAEVPNETDAQQVFSIIQKLEEVPFLVDQARQTSVGQMGALEKSIREIHGKVEDVERVLGISDATLRDEIVKVENTLREADGYLTEAIGKLKTKLIMVTEAAFSTVTSEVRVLYAEGHKIDLKALENLIREQQKVINEIVQQNREASVKGLLNKLNKDFVTKVTTIKDIDPSKFTPKSPLSSAAETLNTAFTEFFAKLRTQKDFTFDFDKISSPNDALDRLLKDLVTSQHFDHEFTKNLQRLKNRLSQFTPEKFGDGESSAVLEALRKGYPALVCELEKAYVSVYDSENNKLLVYARDGKITEDGNRCAKIFLTCVSTWYDDIHKLIKYCSSTSIHKPISMDTEIGKWLDKCGYRVSKEPTGQEGELRNTSELQGKNIITLLTGSKKLLNKYYVGNLNDIFGYLQNYFSLCHLTPPSKPRTPCSVMEMLGWLTGLTHNPVHHALSVDHLSSFFEKREENNVALDFDGISVENQNAKSLDAYPEAITYAHVTDALTELCQYSSNVLTTMAGYGDAGTMYACEYSNNALNLSYPSDPAACFDLLLAIVRKLLPALQFLYKQCTLETEYYGWLQCTYGNGVQTSCWQCGKHPSVHPSSSHTCSDTSPLHLYLTDGLRGMLPHQVTSVGCSSKCNTCPKNPPGMPCITPLGFTTFSGSKRTGKDISNVLGKLLGNVHIKTLLSLQPRPPVTLPEHVAFASSLVTACFAANVSSKMNMKVSLEESITNSSIGLYDEPSDLTMALRNAYGNTENDHNGKTHTHESLDLFSLTKDKTCSDLSVRCGPYLCTLSADSYEYVVYDNADAYLSWCMYSPWNLWRYLKSLLDAFQSIDCKEYGCAAYSTKPGQHGVANNCKCKALMRCRGVLSTLYVHGFTFGNPKILLDGATRKYCSDFRNQLHNVLYSTYFKTLFEQCDLILFKLRGPFIWMNVALWSLSLFYLICVMVGRLDVLHIRSHLRIPSSHKITAQSLLAAAQVGRLAKISYLQP